MQMFSAVGTGCILYYILIVLYTRKLNSTFAWFWAACGLLHLAAGAGFSALPPFWRKIVLMLYFIAWIVFLFIVVQILLDAGRNLSRQKKAEVQYLIIPGAQVRGTCITNSLMRRLDCAYEYLMCYPGTQVIVSGGQGRDEAVSEAQAMADYLEGCGIARSRIIKEEQSVSTFENLTYSAAIIGSMTVPVLIVTNSFHLHRALILAHKAGYQRIYGLAATSNKVLYLNYMVREFFAVLVIYVKQSAYGKSCKILK